MFIFVLILFCFSSFSQNSGLAFFDPDYENHLYQVYKKYHSQSISSSEWQRLINHKNVNIYPMQKGDNLWDVSKVLFGDPNYWPKLWSVNADLSNPHRVSTGHQLQVIMGTEGEAPRAVISGQSITSASQDSTGTVSDSENLSDNLSGSFLGDGSCVDDLSLILHKKGITRVYDQKHKCFSIRKKISARRAIDKAELDNYLSNSKESVSISSIPLKKRAPIPASLPYINLIRSNGVLNFREEGTVPSVGHFNIVTNYQVDEDEIDIVGQVSEILGGIPVPSSELILNLDVPAQEGESFSIIRPIRSIQSQIRNSFILEGNLGEEVVMQARVVIKGNVPGRGGLYFAEVKSMYNPMSINSQVIREDVSSFDLSASFRKGSVKSQIVSSARDQSGSMIMIHSFVYLNKGSSDGLNVGDVFDIQANSRVHGRDIKKSLGEILVVHVTSSYSTAFVKDLNSQSYVGDYAVSFDHLDQYIPDEEEDDLIIEEEEDDLIIEEEEDISDYDEDDLITTEESEDEQPTLDEVELESSSSNEDFTSESDFIDEYEEEDISDYDEDDLITTEESEDEQPTLDEVELESSSSDEDFTSESDFIDEYEEEESEFGR